MTPTSLPLKTCGTKRIDIEGCIELDKQDQLRQIEGKGKAMCLGCLGAVGIVLVLTILGKMFGEGI